jgi:hypothetical protein
MLLGIFLFHKNYLSEIELHSTFQYHALYEWFLCFSHHISSNDRHVGTVKTTEGKGKVVSVL